MMTRHRSTALAALLISLAAAELASPRRSAGQLLDHTPVFLAIPESFPDVDGRVVLMRERGRDVVLLRDTDATPETLSVALSLLRRLRATVPRREGRGQMVPVTGYVLGRPLDGSERDRLDAVLMRLKDRPLARLGNLGRGRSMPFRDREG